MNIKERIDYLVDLINEANYNYYVLDNPTIEDVEYDKYLSDQEQMLDLMREETEEWIDARLDSFKTWLGEILSYTKLSFSVLPG